MPLLGDVEMNEKSKNIDAVEDAVEETQPVEASTVDTVLGVVFLALNVADGSIRCRLTIGDTEGSPVVERMGRRVGEEPFPSWQAFMTYIGSLVNDSIIGSVESTTDQAKTVFGERSPMIKCTDAAAVHWNRIAANPWQPASELLKNRPNMIF
jgi:hypothetical protein